jgi:subtilisin family serine protease
VLALALVLSTGGRNTPGAEGSWHRIEVTAVAGVGEARTWLVSQGAAIEVESGERIQALVPAGSLEAVRHAPEVLRLESSGLPLPLQITPIAETELIGVDSWRDAGFTGQDVHIAILDDGFAGYEEALGVTLPPSAQVIPRSFRADGLPGETDHGLRAAEIVHEIAPGATLHLVNFRTITELSAAVDYLIGLDVTAISFSLGYIHNGPGDGTGVVNDIVSRAADAGIAWVAASGNWAEQHWRGAFLDLNGDSVQEFEAGDSLNGHVFEEGDLITVSLRWDDTWGAACSDYDIELFGPGGELVMASRAIQDCFSDPVESLQVLATSSGTYAVRVIQASDDEDGRRLDLTVVGTPDRGHTLTHRTPQGSLSEPADHPAAITVGALNAMEMEARYSSRGPTADGRVKPNILAPTGLGASAGTAFSGTSSSAPHVAGVIALFQEAFPAADRGVFSTMLQARAAPAPPATEGTPGVRRLDTGTLSGVGPTLPDGSEEAVLLGEQPPGGGLALLSYEGPDEYPARFLHLLTDGRSVAAAYDYDGEEQQWLTWIRHAPDWVNRFETLDGGTYIFRFEAVE